MIEIDGSFGEGGGQIIRTSLALSAMTGTPVKITNVRKKRRKPGLMRQHLTAVRAAARISQGKVVGDELGSSTVELHPGEIAPGEYQFDIGTAGATSLVMQTVLWPLTQANSASTVKFTGGTHNPLCPPFEFLERSFVPAIRELGIDLGLELHRAGFAPAGGGSFTATINPGTPKTKSWTEPLEISDRKIEVLISNLPEKIAQVEIDHATDGLSWDDSKIVDVDSDGPGNIVLATLERSPFSFVASAPGARNKKAKKVVEELVKSVRRQLAANVPVGEHLADQLIIPFALAGGGEFLTVTPSPHTMTQIEVVQKFIEVDVETEKIGEDHWRVTFVN